MGLGVVLTMIVMLIAWVPYLEPSAATSESYRRFAPIATLLAATPVILLLGIPYLWNAARDLGRGRVGSDLLIGLGIFAAYAASIVGLASGHPDALYLDTATGLATLVTLGRWLEATAKERSARGLRAFLSADERPALRLAAGASLASPGEPEAVRASDLAVGDRVLVRPGGRVPADGVVREGRALVDEAALTGEPLPRGVGPGDPVAAPVVATDGALVVEVTAVGAATRLGAVAEVLARARAERSPLERLAERLSSAFVPLVVAIALFVLVRDRLDGGSFAAASLRALAVLVVACPCALGIATPLAVTTAIGRLAERGILVRTGEALGGLPRVRVVAFDKTGTLTEGRPRVEAVEAVEVVGRGPLPGGPPLALAAAVEATSEHGLARAIGAAARDRGIVVPPATDVRVTPGLGVEGIVGGARVRVGRRSFVAEVTSGASDARGAGGRTTEAFVAVDGIVLARVAFGDAERLSARPAVMALAADGIEVHVISGDGAAPTRALAASLGIPEEPRPRRLPPRREGRGGGPAASPGGRGRRLRRGRVERRPRARGGRPVHRRRERDRSRPGERGREPARGRPHPDPGAPARREADAPGRAVEPLLGLRVQRRGGGGGGDRAPPARLRGVRHGGLEPLRGRELGPAPVGAQPRPPRDWGPGREFGRICHVTPLAVTIDWILFVFAALLGAGAWFVYVWALGDGQFKNVEEPAERLLAQDARDEVV